MSWRFALGLVALLPGMAAAQGARPAIAITFDDLPTHGPLPAGTTRVEIAARIIAALKEAKAGEVYGFVNGMAAVREPAAAAALDAWRKAGLPLGNHGWSHFNLDAMSADDYVADIVRDEPLLTGLMGKRDWHWYRFPYLAEGADPATRLAVRQALAARGYRIAAVTMNFADYAWNAPYARCVAAGDKAAIGELETSYLTAASEAAEAAGHDARAAYGRDIPYVLLMHIGAFDAHMLPRLLALYREKGFDFTTIEKAEADPAYAADVNPALPPAPRIRDQLVARSVPAARLHDYMPMLDALCRAPAGPISPR